MVMLKFHQIGDGRTLRFSCGAPSAFKLKERSYLRSTLSRRQLQGFVGRRVSREAREFPADNSPFTVPSHYSILVGVSVQHCGNTASAHGNATIIRPFNIPDGQQNTAFAGLFVVVANHLRPHPYPRPITSEPGH
jgi:hypothetical protein